MATFIKLLKKENHPIWVNVDSITHISPDVGISGSLWTAKLKSEVRYQTYRSEVAYSELHPENLPKHTEKLTL